LFLDVRGQCQSGQGSPPPREAEAQHSTDGATNETEADLFASFRGAGGAERDKPAPSHGNPETQANEIRVSPEGGRKCTGIKEQILNETQETLETQEGEPHPDQDEQLRSLLKHPQEHCRCGVRGVGAADCPVMTVAFPHLDTLRKSWPGLVDAIQKEVTGTGERCVCEHIADALCGLLLHSEKKV